MEHALGITALCLVCGIIWGLTFLWPQVRRVLLIALTIRVAAALVHHFVIPLPYSQADALAFEYTAWMWAQELPGFFEVTNPSYYISWVIAILYRAFGRSALMAQAVSVLFGTLIVATGWLLSRELWDERAARKTAWVITCFPTLVLYSALILREAYFTFFVLTGCLGIVRWLRQPSVRSLMLIMGGFGIGALFHGVAAVGLLAFSFLSIWDALGSLLVIPFHRLSRVRGATMLIAIMGMVLMTLYVTGAYEIPKIGGFSQVMNIDYVSQRMFHAHEMARDEVEYPRWLLVQSLPEMILKLPVRVLYFLFSPFPWDVKKPQHILSLLDGILYGVLTALMWRNRRTNLRDKRSRWLLIVLGSIVVALSLGVGSFVSATRHRAKVVTLLAVLASPRIPRLVWVSNVAERRTLRVGNHP